MKDFLKTESLCLRASELSDAETLFIWENNSGDWFTSNTIYAPLSMSQIEEHIKNCTNNPFADGQLRLMLEDRTMNKTIGTVELTDLNPINGTVTVGFYIDPSMRGKGYGVEMIRLIKEYCLMFLGLRTIAAYTAESNLAARKILEKNGFEVTGRLYGWLKSFDNGTEDMLVCQCISCQSDSSAE